MQSLEFHLGAHLAARYCAPLAFYMLLRASGYMPKDLLPGPFCQALENDHLRTGEADWSRPALTRMLRKAYKAPIVSWQLNGKANLPAMRAVGYLETKREIEFFQTNVYGRSVEELVREGYPVIVTMRPGFGTSENRNIHAVVIAKWDDAGVTVYDPDARNPQTVFLAERVNAFLSPEGGGSIVLPKR
jgi:hypothetical protein